MAGQGSARACGFAVAAGTQERAARLAGRPVAGPIRDVDRQNLLVEAPRRGFKQRHRAWRTWGAHVQNAPSVERESDTGNPKEVKGVGRSVIRNVAEKCKYQSRRCGTQTG
eukprot:2346180-Rhodomonas_salina.3